MKDIGRALEFDQVIFSQIYSENTGHPAANPMASLLAIMVTTRFLRNTHMTIFPLSGLAQIAAASFAPFIASIQRIFGLDDFSGLGLPINFANILSAIRSMARVARQTRSRFWA